MAADVFLSFGAQTGQLEAGLAAAQAAVRATANEMRTLAREMVSTGASADSELGGRLASLGSKLSEAKEGVSGFKEELRGGAEEGGGFIARLTEGVSGFLSPLTAARAGLAEFGEVLLAAFAVERIAKFVERMVELGHETEKANAILGTTNSEVATLSALGAASGVSLSTLETQFARLFKGLAEQTKSAKEGLQTLGLSFEDLAGKGTTEVLEILADRFAALPAGAIRSATAMELFGRAGIEMLPILAQGADGIQHWQEVAKETGTVLSERLSGAMVALHEQTVELGMAIEGVGIATFDRFHTSVDGLVQIMTGLAESFSSEIRENTLLSAGFVLLNASVGGLEIVIAEVIAIFKDLYDAGEAAVESLAVGFVALAKTVAEAFKPISESITAAYDLMSGDVSGAWAHSKAAAEGVDVAKIKQDWTDAATQVDTIWKKFHGDETALNAELEKEIEKITGKQDEQKKKLQETSEAALELKKRFDDIVGSVGASGSAIDELNTKIETLKKALGEVGGTGEVGGAGGMAYSTTAQLADVIKAHEGFRSSAYYDVNHWRVGYGSDTKTSAGGQVSEVTKETTVTEEEANADLMRRITEFSNKSAEQIGDGWAKLSDQVKLSLTDMAYNYGHLPTDVVAAARTGDNATIAAAIRAHDADNAGVNRKLREAEAANVEGTSTPYLTPKERAEGKTALGDLEDKKRKEEEKAAGGGPEEKAKLAAIEAEVAGKGDEIKAQQALVTATKEELDHTNNLEERTKLATKLGEEQVKLEKLKNDATEAGIRLDQQRGKAKGDPEAEHAAAIKLADLKIKEAAATYGQDSAEYKRAVAEKEAADTRFYEEKKRLATQSANEEIAAARTAAQNKVKDIDLEFRAKQISESQKVALTKAALAEEIATEKSIYAQELALDGLRPAERQKILAELAAAETKYAQQVKETQLKAAEDSAKAWKSMGDTVASALNSQVGGIISGTTSVKQAFSNMAKSIIEDVIKYAVKWAVEHAFAATSVMAMNNAVTASTLAGDATKAASATASGAAGIAAQAANATQSIAIDAAKVFGGIFGFLAPVLGPFAAGPAAGGEAAVLSAGAAFDAGAWSLPADMIAGVHRGEMIIPSRGGIADEFRTFIAAGGLNPAVGATSGTSAAASGSRSVSVNPAVHFHVTSPDSASVASFFQNNHKSIVSAVDRAVRHGSALGLRSFTP